MEKLEETLDKIKFTRAGTQYTKSRDMTGDEILHFGMINDRSTKRLTLSLGRRFHDDIYQLLNKIAEEHFADFAYNYIQINKNVKTGRHTDKLNTGETVIFTVGSFSGGKLGLDSGPVSIYKTPYRFDGHKTPHWTEDFDGDRYCVIYYTRPFRYPPRVERPIGILKPEIHSDYITIDEIFNKDIYKTRSLIVPGSRWLDLGANIGAFSLAAHEIGAEVIAYEPCPRNIRKLRRNLPWLEVVEKAVVADDDPAETRPLWLDRNNERRHTVTRKIRGRDSIPVQTVCAWDLPPCDGMKIDIEGMEVAVVEALIEHKMLPRFLVMEYDGSFRRSKKDFDDFVGRLRQCYDEVAVPCAPSKDLNFACNGIMIICKNNT